MTRPGPDHASNYLACPHPIRLWPEPPLNPGVLAPFVIFSLSFNLLKLVDLKLFTHNSQVDKQTSNWLSADLTFIDSFIAHLGISNPENNFNIKHRSKLNQPHWGSC